MSSISMAVDPRVEDRNCCTKGGLVVDDKLLPKHVLVSFPNQRLVRKTLIESTCGGKRMKRKKGREEGVSLFTSWTGLLD